MNSLSSTIYPDGKTFIFYHRRWLDEILQWQDGVLNILNKVVTDGFIESRMVYRVICVFKTHGTVLTVSCILYRVRKIKRARQVLCYKQHTRTRSYIRNVKKAQWNESSIASTSAKRAK